jgi:vacuolar-type H+-ATPase subunit H
LRKKEDLMISFEPNIDRREFLKARKGLERELEEFRKIYAGNTELIAKEEERVQREISELYEKYLDDRRKKMDEANKEIIANTLSNIKNFQSSLQSISQGIGDAFSINRDNKAVLKSLQEEENALRTSLNRRQISYQEYNDKMLEISKKRNDAEAKMVNSFSAGLFSGVGTFFDNLAQENQARLDALIEQQVVFKERLITLEQERISIMAEMKNAEAIADLERQTELKNQLIQNETERNNTSKQLNDANQKALTTSIKLGLNTAISSFATLKKEGASTQKALLVSMLGGLKSAVPLYIADLLGKSLGMLGPIAGPIAAAGVSGLLYAALSVAENSVRGANFFKGGLVKARNSSEYGVDNVPANLTHGEYVLPV